jgi:hypothetical protein
MIDIDKLIREKLDLQDTSDVEVYRTIESKNEYHPKIKDIVNEYIEQIEPCHDVEIEKSLKENGYVVIENFFSKEQVDEIVKLTENLPGYNFHIPNRAFNQETKIFSDDSDWAITAYKMDHMLKNELILKTITDAKLVSLAQSYLGCLPTIHSVNLWWSKFTGEVFHTQKIHRDIDDYKFLAFFIYLSDVDENNGPHVFYPKTQNGSNDLSEKKVITGKAGTAIIADTYAWHHGSPLNEGKRLMIWTRYGLFKNNNFYRDNNSIFEQDEEVFFSKIEDNSTNRYILRAFTK